MLSMSEAAANGDYGMLIAGALTLITPAVIIIAFWMNWFGMDMGFGGKFFEFNKNLKNDLKMNKNYSKNNNSFLFIAIISFNNIVVSQNTSEAEMLLNKVSENIKSYDNIYINYTYTLSNLEEDINQINKGSFVTENDNWKFVMLGVTRIFDGDKLYTISPDDEEVTISTQNPDDETTITPNKMLYFYEEGYNFQMDIVQYIGRKKIQYVKLVPMDSDAEIKYILLGIDVEFNQIYKVIETGINDTQTTIAIVDFEVNLPLEESLFVFEKEKYKDYYMNILD
jgi:hypothetical protein